MGARISDDKNVTLYCSTEGRAFGPVFESKSEAEDFLAWINVDPRSLSDQDLWDSYLAFVAEREGE